MPTTSNFGWTTPADTDLVKDGALAIRTLGNGIDTSMAELKGGTTGQVLSKTSNTDMDFTWVTTDDANAIQNAIVDAKGDLIAASANDTPARLAVGNNGETLLADSSQTTGLRWGANYGFTAGKNKLINGDFFINQRAFTSTTTNGTYGFDRWRIGAADGTVTYSAETFTAGTAPVSGYEAKNYARVVTTGQTLASANAIFTQRVEDVRILADKTITVSFWAKATSGTPKIAIEISQAFGSGGSPSAGTNTYFGQVTLSTSWARYSVTGTMPSLSGKTIGTDANTSYSGLNVWVSAGTDFNSRTGSLGIQSNTFDMWGFQIETGSVATAFQTATGTLAGELAACQRYYERLNADATNGIVIPLGFAATTTQAQGAFTFSVPKRATPSTTIDSANLKFVNYAGSGYTMSSVVATNLSVTGGLIYATVSGATAGQVGTINASAANAYVGFSAEL